MDGLTSHILDIQQAQFQQRVDYAVLRKVLDSQSAAGDAAVRLVESAARSQRQVVESLDAISAEGRLDVTG
ncbi:MAG: hypothetical protein IT438_10635 [Phycisphaerales bacterium]|nr:hypothetical protein [Phycisphaerales bacterium]